MRSNFVENISYSFILSLLFIPALLFGQSNQQIQIANEYYTQGEFEKAGDIYQELSKNYKNIPVIHNNYFNVLLSLNDFKTAEKYLKKALKAYPQNIYYKIDRGLLYNAQGLENEAGEIYNRTIEEVKENDFQIRTAAQYFISKQLTEYALQTYLIGRKTHKIETIYALEIANAYRILGIKDKMIDEYLVFAGIRSSNLRYVKNILQNLLQKEEDKENFKNVLIENIQKYPSQPMYGDLLIWINIQEKNFYAAFIQARALDKRFNENGTRILNLGKIAMENQAFDDAIQCFEYIANFYPEGKYYIKVRRLIVEAREQKIKYEFPVDTLAIRKLIAEYDLLLEDLGKSPLTMEAYRNKALLHAFYMQENDSAIQILNEIISTPRISNNIRSQSKLDLGDIYILIGEPWESTLLYSQVEKSNKSNKIGYLAKLKNAKLNYYRGNFELAKGHLDIIKLATTREIANDAIALSLLIQDNTALDSSDFVMKEFAHIELVEYQNNILEAQNLYNEMLVKYPGHSLTDEIQWKLSNINMKLGEFKEAIKHLDLILDNYDSDILGDDAMYTKAKIYEEYLLDVDKAMDLYKNFLITYPGSVYIAEARKRYRNLRGDNI
ncbi:MAG: tetratricopeptide repeat protein [Reichenbachiella sp.]